MSHTASRPINVITVSGGGAPVVSLTVTGMHQDHPRPSVGNLSTHWHGSTNAFQVTTPGVLAAPPKVTVTRGTSRALTQGPHPPQLVQAAGRTCNAPRKTPQPIVSVSSRRSSTPAFSPPLTTALSAYPPSRPPRPDLLPRPQPMPLSDPSCRGSSDNQDRADSRGFHYAERTNGRPQACHARDFANPRVAPGTLPVDADRRSRYLVGAEHIAGGAPIARKYLDAAWGVTPGTKKSLGLTD